MIIAADPIYPDSMIQYAANTIANILDPDGTGKAWNEDSRLNFSAYGGKIIGGGSTEDLETDSCDNISGWNYCFSM